MTTLTQRTVAVYGSLRRGCYANRYMEGCKFVGQDAISGRLYNLGSFPGLKKAEGNHTVTVDLYSIPDGEAGDQILEGLDRYEGYVKEAPDQSLYRREESFLALNLGKEVIVYVYNGDVDEDWEIPHGDWMKLYGSDEDISSR